MVKTEKVVQSALVLFSLLMALGFLGIVWLMIYGNLSNNLGFTAGTAGFNNTEGVINNMTQGAGTYFGFMPVIFQIAAVVLLISILLGLLALVMFIVKTVKSKNSGFSG